MRTYGNEIVVQRGESFTIDKSIRTANGDPYIISNHLTNPYIVLTVSSSEHAQNNRYVHNYWLKGFKTFYLTSPIKLSDILSSASGESLYPNGFSDITELNTDESGNVYLVAGYYNGKYTVFEPSDAVFYVEDFDGKKTYKYWDVDLNSWEDYRFRITKTFQSSDTKAWVPQNYVWSIQLVSGADSLTYLTGVCDYNLIKYDVFEGTSDKERDDYCEYLYKLLIDNNVRLSLDFNVTAPISSSDMSVVILTPTKLSVLP